MSFVEEGLRNQASKNLYRGGDSLSEVPSQTQNSSGIFSPSDRPTQNLLFSEVEEHSIKQKNT